MPMFRRLFRLGCRRSGGKIHINAGISEWKGLSVNLKIFIFNCFCDYYNLLYEKIICSFCNDSVFDIRTSDIINIFWIEYYLLVLQNFIHTISKSIVYWCLSTKLYIRLVNIYLYISLVNMWKLVLMYKLIKD